MSRFNTGNNIGSLTEEDFYDNCLSLDQAMNSTDPTWRDRFNVEKPTIDAALKSVGFMPAGFDFVTGGTLQPGDRNKAVYNPAPNGDNNWYRWNGAFPKEIAANSQPNPKDENNWVPVIIKTGVVEREALRRTYQEVGLNLVEGSFEQGAVITSTTDVVLHEKTGKCFSGPTGNVPKGTIPNTPTYAIVSDKTLKTDFLINEVTPEQYGADGTDDGDTTALLKCMEVAYNTPTKITLSRMYKVNKPLRCYFVQSHNKSLSIIGKTRDCGFILTNSDVKIVLDVHGYRAKITDLRFIYAPTEAPNLAFGLRICGEENSVSRISGSGAWGKLCLGVATIRSAFSEIHLNGGNISYGVGLQLMASVNCTAYGIKVTQAYCPVSYGALPNSAETSNDLKPPSLLETITWGNEGLSLNGSKSVATTIGLVLSGLELVASDCVTDLTKEQPLFVGGLFIKITNCWFQPNSTFVKTNAIGYTSTIGHLTIFNTTLAGTGSSKVLYDIEADYLQMVSNTIYKSTLNASGGGDRLLVGNIAGVDGVITKGSTSAGSIDIMNGDTKSKFSKGILVGKEAANSEGKIVVRIDSGERGLELLTAMGKVLSTTMGGMEVNTVTPSNSSVLFVGSMASTGRSVSARGTINANGADYAEYILKSEGCLEIQKGAVCGINKQGELTTNYDDSVSFVIKSTNPSIVGGDPTENFNLNFPQTPELSRPVYIEPILRYGTSETELEKVKEKVKLVYDEELKKYYETLNEYENSVVSYNKAYEEFRAKYDRVAFCGQAPCILTGSKPGDYLVPIKNEKGGISGKFVTEPSFDEYRKAIGMVWKVNVDGSCSVVVKVI